MAAQSQGSARPRWMPWAGWGTTGLMIVFLLFDSVSKLVLEQHAVEATTKIGYPLDVIRPLGITGLACTILYAIPRTPSLLAIASIPAGSSRLRLRSAWRWWSGYSSEAIRRPVPRGSIPSQP